MLYNRIFAVVLIYAPYLRPTWNTFFFLLWRCDPTRVMASSFLRFLNHTQRRSKVGRTPLDEWSARRRDLYLTTHNTHNRQTSMPPVGFEPTISAGEQPQTYALDRAATGTDKMKLHLIFIWGLNTNQTPASGPLWCSTSFLLSSCHQLLHNIHDMTCWSVNSNKVLQCSNSRWLAI